MDFDRIDNLNYTEIFALYENVLENQHAEDIAFCFCNTKSSGICVSCYNCEDTFSACYNYCIGIWRCPSINRYGSGYLNIANVKGCYTLSNCSR